MNEMDNAHRSVRRFIAEALSHAGDPETEDGPGTAYKVRTEDEQVADQQRPQAVVTAVTPAEPGQPPRVSVPQGDFQLRQTFAAVAYPEVAGTPRVTRLRATTVVNLLQQAALIGLVDDDGLALTYPGTIPLFDYTGVPVEGPDRADLTAALVAYSFLDVLSSAARAIPDAADDRRWTAVLTLRVSWWVAGRDRANAADDVIATRVPGTWKTH